MKFKYLSLSLVLIILNNLFVIAQNNKPKDRFFIGVESGKPLFSKKSEDFTLGGVSVRAEGILQNQLSLQLNSGISAYALPSNGCLFLYLSLGLKYFLQDPNKGLFVSYQLGIGDLVYSVPYDTSSHYIYSMYDYQSIGYDTKYVVVELFHRQQDMMKNSDNINKFHLLGLQLLFKLPDRWIYK